MPVSVNCKNDGVLMTTNVSLISLFTVLPKNFADCFATTLVSAISNDLRLSFINLQLNAIPESFSVETFLTCLAEAALKFLLQRIQLLIVTNYLQ